MSKELQAARERLLEEIADDLSTTGSCWWMRLDKDYVLRQLIEVEGWATLEAERTTARRCAEIADKHFCYDANGVATCDCSYVVRNEIRHEFLEER
jgi:hypothetical protein